MANETQFKIVGNYLVVKDVTTRNEYFRTLVGAVRFTRTPSDEFIFFNNNNTTANSYDQQRLNIVGVSDYDIPDSIPESRTSFSFSDSLDPNGDPFPSADAMDEWLSSNVGVSQIIIKELPSGSPVIDLEKIVFVAEKSDFPSPIGGIITLLAGITYYVLADIDLTGDRLVGGSDTVIIGSSSENCSITSTGLGVGVALFTTKWTTPVRHITFKDVDTCIDIDGNINPPVALDWTGVNFSNIPNIGTIDTCDNWIYSKGAVLSSRGLTFTGSVGTIGIDNSIFVGDGAAGAIIDIDAGCTVTRRFRPIYCSFVAFGSTNAINVDALANVPVEGYILDTINFSGGSTYLTGVQYTDNKTRFVNCKGITNTAEFGNYYMTGNTTATIITTPDTPVKAAGTTTANPINQKFSHTDNRVTYTGALARSFQISATASLTSGNNRLIGLYVAKNGVVISDSEMYSTTSGTGRSESIGIQTITAMSENDYIEVWVENETHTEDITVEYLNVICKSIN